MLYNVIKWDIIKTAIEKSLNDGFGGKKEV